MLRLVVAAFAAVVLVTGCGSEDDPPGELRRGSLRRRAGRSTTY